MGIFGFLQRRRARKERQQMADLWTYNLAQAKYAIMKQVEPLIKQRYPNHPDFLRFLTLVSYYVVEEPPGNDIKRLIENFPNLANQAAELAADVRANADADLDASIGQVWYSCAMLLLGDAYNPNDPFNPNTASLRDGLRCLDYAILYGDDTALYYSTAVQICGMLRDYESGYRYASLAIEADPHNPEVWRMAGLASIGVDRYAEAEERLVRARALWPGIAGVDEPLALARARKT